MGKHEATKVGGHKVKLKDGSQWVKIPDNHPAIISKELYDRAQVLRPHASSEKKISIHTPCAVRCSVAATVILWPAQPGKRCGPLPRLED